MTKDDLISRQPETHEERTETHACDCISRQAAIAAFDCTDELIIGGSANAQNVTNYINKVIGKIKALPSAQPEIIHCRECKHRGEKPIADGRYWCEIHDTFMYYCSDAERRTDE